MKTRDHAERREHRLALTGENADAGATDLFGRRNELRPILRVATRGRGDRQDFLDLDGLTQLAEAAQRDERLFHRVRREQPGRLHLAAEAREDLLIVDRGKAARE